MRARNVYLGANSNRRMGLLLAVCAMMMLGGCGSSDEAMAPIETPTLVDQGWEAFETGDFAGC